MKGSRHTHFSILDDRKRMENMVATYKILERIDKADKEAILKQMGNNEKTRTSIQIGDAS